GALPDRPDHGADGAPARRGPPAPAGRLRVRGPPDLDPANLGTERRYRGRTAPPGAEGRPRLGRRERPSVRDREETTDAPPGGRAGRRGCAVRVALSAEFRRPGPGRPGGDGRTVRPSPRVPTSAF